MTLQEKYLEWMAPRMVHIPFEAGGKEYLIPGQYQFHLLPDICGNRLAGAFLVSMDHWHHEAWYLPSNWNFT